MAFPLSARVGAAEFLEAAPAPLLVLGPGDRLLAANTAFSDLVGDWRPLEGQPLGPHLAVADGDVSLHAQLQSASGAVDRGWLRPDGSAQPLAWSARPLPGGDGALLCTVSASAADPAAAAQAQRMESLGTMAGGLAHDFNNLLTAILGFAGLIKLSPSLDDEARDHLDHLEQAARRGADIAGRLLAFARGGLARFTPLDLREVVEETVALVRPALHPGIDIDVHLPDAPAMVDGDFGQVQQALLNILVNARDALASGGHVSVRLLPHSRSVVLLVSDDGPGMDEEVKARVFEPFFSTKGPGSGTGLGLAIAYGIVRGHRGSISLESEPGRGSVFRIELPLAEVGRPTEPASAGGGDLVLVVDDDDLTRKSVSRTLARLGYNVVEAAAGPVAVDLVAARPGRFAAVLLDLVMPGMTGRDVFHRLKAIRADLPVIICTGYAPGDHIDDEMKRSVSGLLQKPFDTGLLSRALRAAGAVPAAPPRVT